MIKKMELNLFALVNTHQSTKNNLLISGILALRIQHAAQARNKSRFLHVPIKASHYFWLEDNNHCFPWTFNRIDPSLIIRSVSNSTHRNRDASSCWSKKWISLSSWNDRRWCPYLATAKGSPKPPGKEHLHRRWPAMRQAGSWLISINKSKGRSNRWEAIHRKQKFQQMFWSSSISYPICMGPSPRWKRASKPHTKPTYV